jgi:hypothetical protein
LGLLVQDVRRRGSRLVEYRPNGVLA